MASSDAKTVKIIPSEIPKLELKLFCLALAEAAERFYSIPENEAGFQAWLASRTEKGGQV